MKIEKIEQFSFADPNYKTPGRPPKYPFSELNPGEKLLIPVVDIDSDTPANAAKLVSTALTNWKRRNGLEWHSAVRHTPTEVHIYRFN